MTGLTKEMVIRNKSGGIVSRMNVIENKLHGHCEWYDGKGDLIAYGIFKDGIPFTGTFLNWAKFLTELDKEYPYNVENYCKDWVTIFETHFLSEQPKYELILEAFFNNEKLS